MPMNKEIHSYLSFLSFCLSDTRPVPSCVSSINWTKLLEFAKKQTVVGIFAERLLNDNEALLHDEGFLSNKPTDEDVMAWMSAKNMVTTLNKKVDEVAVWTAKNFKATGYDACILKGQGAALLYPHKAMRTPGDVDVWVRKTRENTAGKRRKTQGEIDSEIHDIIQYVHKIVPKAKACYHHIDFISPKGVSIEVHYRPQWLNNPWHNRRLQCFFQEMAEEQFTNYVHLSNSTKDTAVPTIDFNVVFMLAHLYNHLLHEGIGLRQLIDYYELLKRRQESGDTSKTDIAKTIDRLGLMPIAGAVMWLLKEFLGLEAECLIVPPNERLGKVVLREMVAGGNFGKYDERTLSGAYNSPFMKTFNASSGTCVSHGISRPNVYGSLGSGCIIGGGGSSISKCTDRSTYLSEFFNTHLHSVSKSSIFALAREAYRCFPFFIFRHFVFPSQPKVTVKVALSASHYGRFCFPVWPFHDVKEPHRKNFFVFLVIREWSFRSAFRPLTFLMSRIFAFFNSSCYTMGRHDLAAVLYSSFAFSLFFSGLA